MKSVFIPFASALLLSSVAINKLCQPISRCLGKNTLQKWLGNATLVEQVKVQKPKGCPSQQ